MEQLFENCHFWATFNRGNFQRIPQLFSFADMAHWSIVQAERDDFIFGDVCFTFSFIASFVMNFPYRPNKRNHRYRNKLIISQFKPAWMYENMLERNDVARWIKTNLLSYQRSLKIIQSEMKFLTSSERQKWIGVRPGTYDEFIEKMSNFEEFMKNTWKSPLRPNFGSLNSDVFARFVFIWRIFHANVEISFGHGKSWIIFKPLRSSVYVWLNYSNFLAV